MLAALFVDHGAVPTNTQGLTTVTLVGRQELDAAVPVLVVVPVYEPGHPLTGLVFRGKYFAGIIRPILYRSEQGFGVRVVVGRSWSRERPEHAQLLQPAFLSGRTQLC